MELDDPPCDDPVYLWRKHRLLESGFTERQAVVLAASTCDLHEACELVARGADPAVAFDIAS